MKKNNPSKIIKKSISFAGTTKSTLGKVEIFFLNYHYILILLILLLINIGESPLVGVVIEENPLGKIPL